MIHDLVISIAGGHLVADRRDRADAGGRLRTKTVGSLRVLTSTTNK
jgi:hypothetical protein